MNQNKFNKYILILVVFFFISSKFILATVINVPEDQPTIQDGLNSANEGDTVLVANGTYFENLFWPATTGIKLLSQAGADSTIIDGSNSSVVITIFGIVQIDTTTIIEGFTIQNGQTESGFGVTCNNASPIVINCEIISNIGGGLALTNSSLVLRNNEIKNNTGIGIKGVDNSNLMINNCDIENNTGSGIYLSYSVAIITESNINGNSSGIGGGVYCFSSTLIMEGVTVNHNSTYSAGGGIYLKYSDNSTLNNVIVTGNSATDGGGIYCYESSINLTNVNISENISNNEGGGIIFKQYSNSNLFNCIISKNNSFEGGGIYCDNSSPLIEKSYIIENSATYGGGIYLTSGVFTTTTMIDVVFSKNFAGMGGGIFLWSCNITMSDVYVISNYSNQYGGGIYCYDSNLIFQGGNIVLNISGINEEIQQCRFGGGVYIFNSNPVFEGVTISQNSSTLGGGFYFSDNSNGSILHCTITYNLASEEGDGIYTINGSEPLLNYSNITLNNYGIFNDDPLIMIDASNCFWGDTTGPYHLGWNPDGLGDSVNVYVNPIPFLTEADTTAPPIPPFGLDTLEVGDDFVTINWQNSPIGDLAGYKVYFDSDSSGFPYTDTIDVGFDTTYTFPNLTEEDTVYVAVTCYDNSSEESWYSREVVVTLEGIMGIDEGELTIPKDFTLFQNYPNPFNPKTTISYQLPKSSFVSLSIYNLAGQLVEILVNEEIQPGYHSVMWDASNFGSGLYLFKITTREYSETGKCLLVK